MTQSHRNDYGIEAFARLAALPEGDIVLVRAAFHIAGAEYPDMDLEEQLGLLDSLAAAAARRIGDAAEPLTAVNRLSEYLFDEVGFYGNEQDYYNPRNSFLNDVLSRRTGIPIALSLVCIAVGERCGVPLVAIGLPGHLVIRHRSVEDWFIDPFHGGILLSQQECEERLQQMSQGTVSWDPSFLTPIGNREFIARMLRNLKAIYLGEPDYRRGLAVMDRLILIQPEARRELRDRGLLHYQMRNFQSALEDLQDYCETTENLQDIPGVQRLMARIQREIGR